MAAIARPQISSGSVKVALIVFVVLTVLSLAGTIIILTQYQDMQTRETEALNQRDQKAKSLQAMEEQFKRFSQIAVGAEPTTDVPTIQQKIDEVRKRVAVDPALKEAKVSLAADTALVTMLKTLLNQYGTTSDDLKKASAQLHQLLDERKDLIKNAEATRKEFTDKGAQLEKKYQELEQVSAKDRAAWQQQVANLTRDLEKASEAAGAQLTGVRQQLQAVTKDRDEAQTRVKELVATLASFRPQADLTSALQIADGQVVRAVAGENIVYISLGERDGLKRGVTFAVYSRAGGIPADGKGKATVRVDEVFETTAECKVTSSTPTDPIVEGDVVANPVFDKSRKLNFVVAGDYDLNFDGQIDDPGGVEVARLITQAGGNVVKTIDTRTDFVVLGAPPPLAVEAGAKESPEAQERAAKRAADRKAFDGIIQEAKALSVPVLSRTQFLHFVGIKVPRNASEDKPPG